MSTNWKAGDKALCVDDSPADPNYWCPKDAIQLVKGVIYLVNRVGISDGGFVVLGVAPNPAMEGYGCRATRFRKIVPACDRATNQEEGLIPHEGFWEGRT